ncbi:MAG: ROK family protein [Actinocatenispora sp.]
MSGPRTDRAISHEGPAAGEPGDTGPDDGVLLGVDIGGTKVALATADLDGHILERALLETLAERGADQVMDRTIDAARTLIASAGGRCLAVGTASPGIVRSDGNLLSPNIPGWERVRLAERFRIDLAVPNVAAGNDVKTAAIAEVRHGALRGADPAIFLSLGTGVAAAIVHDGQIVPGAHGAAGEFGYNLRGVSDRYGAADGRCPLEEAVGGRGIIERAATALGTRVTAAELFARTDSAARELVDEILDELAVHVANLAIAVDPDRIAVGGGLTADTERMLGALQRRLRQAVPFPPDLVTARYQQDGALVGALTLAADCRTARHPTDASC